MLCVFTSFMPLWPFCLFVAFKKNIPISEKDVFLSVSIFTFQVIFFLFVVKFFGSFLNNLKTRKSESKNALEPPLWFESTSFESSYLLLLFYKAPQDTAHPLCHSGNLNTHLVFWYQILLNHHHQGSKKSPSDRTLLTAVTTTSGSSSTTLN